MYCNCSTIRKKLGHLASLAQSEEYFAAKLRGPGFKSWPGTVSGPATIIKWSARPCCKLALS